MQRLLGQDCDFELRDVKLGDGGGGQYSDDIDGVDVEEWLEAQKVIMPQTFRTSLMVTA